MEKLDKLDKMESDRMELDKTHVDNKNLKFIKHVRSQSKYNIYTYH